MLAWAQRQAKAHHAQAPREPRDPKRSIRVRHFAGPLAHVDEVSHLRVVHLTDLHVGRVTPLQVHKAAVELANAENPDLVVITGDFVCHSQVYLSHLREVIRAINAPVVCVLGNHDHWSGAKEVSDALVKEGACVLSNQHTVLTLRNQRLQIVGLDDAYTGNAFRDQAIKGMRRDLPTLGLSHIAEEADGLWEHGVPLVLSGHTHAGQVTLAGLHELLIGKVGGHKYVHGLYGSRGRAAPGDPKGAVYVGAGIGAAVIPLRLGERGMREVTVFELGHRVGEVLETLEEQTPLPGRKPSERLQWKRAQAAEAQRIKREHKKKARHEP